MAICLFLGHFGVAQILLVLREHQDVRELIVVPVEILPRLLTELHVQFNYPTKHQLNKLFDRYFHAISSSKHVEDIVELCN